MLITTQWATVSLQNVPILPECLAKHLHVFSCGKMTMITGRKKRLPEVTNRVAGLIAARWKMLPPGGSC